MKKLLVFLILLFISGCASVSVQKYNKDLVYPATNPVNIVIFPEKPKIGSFSELGEITVTGANNWPQIEKIFRSKAAEMGADAVYVFSKQEETRQYISPDDCYVYGGYYYPYHHFGWRRYQSRRYYPRGYYYCYGYQSIDTSTFISAIGIAIKYMRPAV
jgi:hypothetical protein